MAKHPFYKDHWVNIEEERLERYQQMFSWNPASKPLYEAADIGEGHVVADFGCGPGHTAIELARWVGQSGHIHALDINADFIDQCDRNAKSADVSERVYSHICDGSDLPLDASSIDRITTRNTLIYVDQPEQTLGEFHRVLKNGGRAHAIEGDWLMMIAEPIPGDTWNNVVQAASHACCTPDIGRKLPVLFAEAGFENVQLDVMTRADLDGRLLPMIRNMAGYARNSGQMDASEIDGAIRLLEEGLADNAYLVLAPQFVIAADR